MLSTTQVLLALRRRGLSQSELSRQTGIPQSRLSRWERGQVPPALDDDQKLRRLLGAAEAAPDLAQAQP